MANNSFTQTEYLGLYIAPSDQNHLSFLEWRNHMGGTVNAPGGSNMHILDKVIGDMKNEKAGKSIMIDTAIPTFAWSDNSGTFHCYIYHSAITASCPIEMIPRTGITKEQYDALKDADIIGGVQADGELELIIMGDKPLIDIPINFIIRRDI